MLTYKGYTAEVRLDFADGMLYGRIVGTTDVVTFQADRVADLQAALHTNLDTYLRACAEMGRQPETPAPGRFLIRTTADRHALITRAAGETGKSVNEWAEETLTHAAEAVLASTPERGRLPVEV